MPIGLIISIAVILGTFEACYNEAKKCEQFLREQKERGSDEAGTTKEHTEINPNK